MKTMQASRKRTSDQDVKIGRRIRAIRLKAGESQTALAAVLGITFQQIQKYENGTNRVSSARMMEIVRHYRCSVTDVCPPMESVTGDVPMLDYIVDVPAARLNAAFSRVKSGEARRKIADSVEMMCSVIEPA